MTLYKINVSTHFIGFSIKYNRHLLPYGRADLAPSASLRPIRGGGPQLHVPMPCICGNLDS